MRSHFRIDCYEEDEGSFTGARVFFDTQRIHGLVVMRSGVPRGCVFFQKFI
jgi:hypothetical protein